MDLNPFEGTVVDDYRYMELIENHYRSVSGVSARDDQGQVTSSFQFYLLAFNWSRLSVKFKYAVDVRGTQYEGIMIPSKLAVDYKLKAGQKISGHFYESSTKDRKTVFPDIVSIQSVSAPEV